MPKTGKHILKRPNELKNKHEIIGDVRGIGLMVGVELVKNKRSKILAISGKSVVLCKASEKGLLLLPAGKNAIRICSLLQLLWSRLTRELIFLRIL